MWIRLEGKKLAISDQQEIVWCVHFLENLDEMRKNEKKYCNMQIFIKNASLMQDALDVQQFCRLRNSLSFN